MWIGLGIWIKIEHRGRLMSWKKIPNIISSKMRKRNGLNLWLRKYFWGRRNIHTPAWLNSSVRLLKRKLKVSFALVRWFFWWKKDKSERCVKKCSIAYSIICRGHSQRINWSQRPMAGNLQAVIQWIKKIKLWNSFWELHSKQIFHAWLLGFFKYDIC